MKLRYLFIIPFLLPFVSHAQITPGDNLEVRGVPPIPKALVERTLQYQNVRSASVSDWDASGKGLYISTRFGNTAQVHHVAAPGAARRQITFFEEPVGGLSVDRRKGRQGFTFTRDIGGGEFYQIYYFDQNTGTATLLTDGKSRNSGASWTKAGDKFTYSSNRRNGKDTDVWIMDPDQRDKTWVLTEREGSWYPSAWSPDGKQLVVTQYVSANKSLPYIVDLASKNMTPLFRENDGDVSYSDFNWAPDGKTIYFTADIEREFQTLYAYDVGKRSSRCVLPDLKWNIERISISDNGAYMAYTLNEDGISTLRVVRLPSMKPVKTAALPVGLIGGLDFSPDSKRLALSINAANSPTDVYVLSLPKGKLTRWTFSEVGGLNAESFVTPKLIHYPTFDKVDGKPRLIPAFVSMPKEPKGKMPVIIDIHGGPEGQSRPSFSTTEQYWVNELGCVVISPNVRGSTGYGKTYLALDNGFNREHSVQDIGALLDWIAQQPELDKDRVAVLGGSYGGYMVLAALTTYPDRIKCGVDVVGISNFVTFLENTQSYRRDLRRVEYGDERDPAMREFLLRISPTTNAGKIRAPLFVAQGENDPRVPASEARQIINAVQANGVPVWSLFAKDEGHGFSKKNNRDYFTWATILFFEEFLLKK
jgi:dipeptidyl aminopeptidase/acylaminoacyl peptidase